MKKAILILASALMMGISVSAQEFNPHWYIQARGGVAETVGETAFKDLLSPAADLAIGYQFSPVFGLRGDFMGWQAKGAQNGMYGTGATEVYKFNFAQAALDATFDICSIFNENLDRFLRPYLYLGVGANLAFNNDEAQALAAKGASFQYLWDGKKFGPSGRGGLGFDFRLSDAIKLNLEAGVNVLSDHFNSKKNDRAKTLKQDFQYTALAGLKIALGATKKAAPAPVVVPPAPAPAPAPKPEPKPEPKPVVVEQPAPAPAPELQENIYFIIDKWNIQASEVAKLDEIAAFMAANPDTKVQLTGHADKATGTAARNLFLSEKRAEVVTNELIKRGVAASRISSTFKGDTANPYATPEENRVTVCFVK